MPITLASAQAQDARDALAPLRQEFNLPDGVIYLDGNSLGAQPKAALARAQQVIQQEWGVGLIRSWNTAGWFELPQRLAIRIGRGGLAGVRERLENSDIPKAFKGFPISLVIASFMAVAFMGFGGLVK